MMVFRYSAIDTAYSCLEKFNLKYLQGEKSDYEGLDMHFGTAIHLSIQSFFEGDDPLVQFNMYWNSMKGRDLKRFRFSWEDLQGIGNVMLDKWLRLHAKKYKPVSIEKELRAKIGPYEFTGTPDFIGEYDGKPSVVDFKAFTKEITPERIESNEQMFIYDEMARQTLGYDAEQIAYVGFIKPEKRIQTNRKLVLTPEKRSAMLSNVVSMADLMVSAAEKKVFPKNRNSCDGCDMFSKCYGRKQ